MNEFGSYENFFCSSYQSTDLIAPMHMLDHDLTTSAHYFNAMPTDLPQQNHQHQQQQQQQQSVHQQSSSYPLISNCQQQQQQQQQQKQQQQFTHSGPAVGGCAAAGDRMLGSRNANVSNGSSAPNNTVFGNIPFVQIHTTDVQLQRRSFGNVFRRSAANVEEIKSEPIKSESADGSKERVNSTPTPPVRSASCNSSSGERVTTHAITKERNCADECAAAAAMKAAEHVLSALDEPNTERIVASPAVQKCIKCPFLGLSETELDLHLAASHTGNLFADTETYRMRLACPGCANIFYVQNSLLVHLREDHLMTPQAAKIVMEAVQANASNSQQQQTHTNEITTNSNTEESPPKDQQRKSRIYLKNVECLREPPRESLGQQEHQIAENFFFENDCSAMGLINADLVAATATMDDAALIELLEAGSLDRNSNITNCNNNNNHGTSEAAKGKVPANAPKQKISIKSVDVLREPAFLRRDYGMQNFNAFGSACSSDLEMHSMANSEANQYNYSDANEQPTNMMPGSSNDASCAAQNLENQFEKPRRPKIYIRNVDILKEPMMLPNSLTAPNLAESNNAMSFGYMPQSLPQTTPQYLNSGESMSATSQIYDPNLSHLPMGGMSEPYLFEQGSSGFMPSVTDVENYTYATNANSNNFLLDNARYANELDCGLDSSHSSSTPIVTEPTPPPQPTMGAMAVDGAVPPVVVVAALPPQKQKIFIKNVDVLKAPQFQEPRGTLHLRTVDELNLMNKNEVENLIAPNLDNTPSLHGGGSGSGIDGGCENSSEHSDLPDDLLYAAGNCFKLHDFDAHVVNNWTDDYDLGDDLDCIITNSTTPLGGNVVDDPISPHKIVHDLDTPQMSLISIRDIEELTGGVHPTHCGSTDSNACTPERAVAEQMSAESETSNHNIALHGQTLPSNGLQSESDSIGNSQATSAVPEQLKKERVSITTGIAAVVTVHLSDKQANSAKTNTADFSDVPPLVPVTSITGESFAANAAAASKEVPTRLPSSNIPMPPLVPVSPLIQVNVSATRTTVNATNNTAPQTALPALANVEKARIYVANNLLQRNPDIMSASKAPIAVTVTGGTSVRGRPFGAKRSGITKIKKLHGVQVAELEVGMKCSMQGCAFRFKKPETLEYHRRCHKSDSGGLQLAMVCPECKSSKFTNWNTLHTHLWRSHQVDMELYSCELCSFKTPIYSRLINTHSKIHYDDRNYKCDQCEKAFKNTKQLKNHRRWHRNHTITASGGSANTTPTDAPALHRCEECRAVFSHHKSLREHTCKSADNQAKCHVCGRAVSSKSSLKLHMLTHEMIKRFKCSLCQYTSNDHNAFRRHKMTHENVRSYVCPHCSYKSIQSVAYQKHVQQKHPDMAAAIIHKCLFCPYSTINRALFTVHQARHEAPKSQHSNNATNEKPAPPGSESKSVKNIIDPFPEATKNKIKVKSNLMVTQTTQFSSSSNNSNALDNVTTLLTPAFETAVT